jgi:hypothetical protein
VDVDDIIDYDPKHYTMLSELWDGGAGRRTLRKLEAKRLTLSMQGWDLVYMTVVSKKGHNGTSHSKINNQKLTVGIDLGKKTVKMLEPYNSYGYVQPFTLCQQVNMHPPQQNMGNTDGYYNKNLVGYTDGLHAGYAYNISGQHPPLSSPSVPPHLNSPPNSLGSGNNMISHTTLSHFHLF